MVESRPNRHARANAVAVAVAPGAGYNLRSNDGKRAYATALLGSENPADRALGREYLAAKLAAADAETVLALVLDQLTAFPEEQLETLRALEHYLDRTKSAVGNRDERLWTALQHPGISADDLAKLLSRVRIDAIASESRGKLVRRIVAALVDTPDLAYGPQTTLGARLTDLVTPELFQDPDDERPGGAVLEPLLHAAHVPQDRKVWAIATWMSLRNWSREREARIDAAVDPELRALALIHFSMVLARRHAPYYIDVPLIEALLTHATAPRDSHVSDRATELIMNAVTLAAVDGVTSRVLIQRIVDLALSPDLALAARRRFVRLVLAHQHRLQPAELKERGITVRHPGIDAPLDVILAAYHLGAMPQPGDLARIGTRLQELLDRAPQPESRFHRATLLRSDFHSYIFLHQALQAALHARLALLKPEHAAHLCVLEYPNDDVKRVRDIAWELPFLDALFQDDPRSWREVLCAPQAPPSKRTLFYDLLVRAHDPKVEALLRGPLLADPEYAPNAAEMIASRSGHRALIDVVAATPSSHHAKFSDLWCECARVLPDDVLRLSTLPAVRAVPELYAVLQRALFERCFPSADRAYPPQTPNATLDAIFPILLNDRASRANPLVAMEKCLANVAPGRREEVKQFFCSQPPRFAIVYFVTKRSLRKLPADLLVALFRKNSFSTAAGSERTRAILRDWLLHGDARVALESLRCLSTPISLGMLGHTAVRERLFAIGRTLHEGELRSLVEKLWTDQRYCSSWPRFLRDAYHDSTIPDGLLRAVGDLPGIARAWAETPEELREDAEFRRRLVAGALACAEQGPNARRLNEGDRANLADLLAGIDEPSVESFRRQFATGGTSRQASRPAAIAPPDADRTKTLVERVGQTDITDEERCALLSELAPSPHLIGMDASPLLRLLATAPMSLATNMELHRVLARVGARALYLGTLLNRNETEAKRLNCARFLAIRPEQPLREFASLCRELRWLIELTTPPATADPVLAAALRQLIEICAILPARDVAPDAAPTLLPDEVDTVHRWLALQESGRMEQYWASGDVGEGPSEVADLRVLLSSFCTRGIFRVFSEDQDYAQHVLRLPLAAEERLAALDQLAQVPKFLNFAAVSKTLADLAWGDRAPELRDGVRVILERAIKSNYYPSHPLCVALVNDPRVPEKLRFRALLRLGRAGGRNQTLAIAPLLLGPTLSDAQRERGFTVLRESACRLKIDAAHREALLAMIGDRRRTIGLRKALIQSLRLLELADAVAPQPVHWEAGEAIEGAPDETQNDLQATLWGILGDDRLPNVVRSVALQELLATYHVPASSRLHTLLGDGVTTQHMRWLLQQLRAANRLADHSWRHQVVSHPYRTDLATLQKIAEQLPHLPPGLALYAADFVHHHPHLGPAIERAFSLRRGAIASSAAIGTWLRLLDQVQRDQVPPTVLSLFQLPEDREADDPTPMAEIWLQWQSLQRMTTIPDGEQILQDTSRSFAERAVSLEHFIYRQTAAILQPASRDAQREESLDRTIAALRAVSPHTPAPLVLAGHYSNYHRAGLPLLGDAVTAWAEGSWGDFRYDLTTNRTLAGLPPETVAAWRAPLGFAVPEVHANETFIKAACAIANTAWAAASELPGLPETLSADWRAIQELRTLDKDGAKRVVAFIQRLEAKAVAAGQEVARGTSRDEAARRREQARTLRFLANLARFAFLDPDALAVNELRAVGEPSVLLADGTVRRAVSVWRAFDRLQGQARDLRPPEALVAALSRTGQLLRQLPEFPERADLVVEERDDFPTLIEIGARPYGSGSCQNYQSAAGYNRGLLAYVCDGDKKAIVAREARAIAPGTPPDLRARAILRLGRTIEGDPALLLEPIYAAGGRGNQLRQEIERLACQKAEALKAVLLRSGGDGNAIAIDLAPSRNGFQYEDSGGGLRSDTGGYRLTVPILADFRSHARISRRSSDPT